MWCFVRRKEFKKLKDEVTQLCWMQKQLQKAIHYLENKDLIEDTVRELHACCLEMEGFIKVEYKKHYQHYNVEASQWHRFDQKAAECFIAKHKAKKYNELVEKGQDK